MIDKSTFRATEKKLYNYFSKDKKMNSINRKMDQIVKQITEIEKDIEETNISIPEESRSIAYEERVQSSSDATSYAERTAIRIIENLEKEKANKQEEIILLKQELRTIEDDCSIIGSNVGQLDEESLKFLKTKYSGHVSDWEVGQKLDMSQSTAYRTRVELVEDVARWEVWFKNMNKN